MLRNKSYINFICATLCAALLMVSVSGAVRSFGMAVGPLADPIYNTEIIAFKDYVEQNLSAPQLDIMFFLIGGLAVAQMGAQDAMLISPYPNEESVKEWIINCGIQLYNSVIGLVPEGDYYMGIPSIGTSGTKGVPREVIKGLVAQMMGDAVVAINYPDLDTFLEENPNEILLPFNADLQLGVNAVFGLNGSYYNWQFENRPYDTNFTWTQTSSTPSESVVAVYNVELSTMNYPRFFVNSFNNSSPYLYNSIVNMDSFKVNILIGANTIKLYYDNGTEFTFLDSTFDYLCYQYLNGYSVNHFTSHGVSAFTYSYSGTLSIPDLLSNYFNFRPLRGRLNGDGRPNDYNFYFNIGDFLNKVYIGNTWDNKTEYINQTDLNLLDIQIPYYQQVQNDYLFDLRGLMGDLVNYVYLNPIWDNIYDLVGNLVLPDRVNVTVDLTPITELLAPPIPVNMNDIALYTENDYLEKLKEHAKNYGETLGEYFVFWHNSDPVTVYVIFGSFIVVLIGAFIGKWGHS